MPNRLAHRLLVIREQFNLSQSDIATLFSISRDAYGRYERGDREPKIDFIVSFCRHFDISADYLLGLTDTLGRPKTNTLPAPKPVDPFSDLTPEQRTVMETTLNAFRQQNAAAREEA